MRTNPQYTTHIYCLSHDTKEAFIVDTITGKNKESSLKKAKDLCQRYNEQWEKLIQISYCINEKDNVEYESLSNLANKKRKRSD